MLDVRDLEQRWKKYNRKRKLPLYISVFSVLAILSTIGVYKYYNINFSNKFAWNNHLNFFKKDISSTKYNEEINQNSVTRSSGFLINDKFNRLELKNEIGKNTIANNDTVTKSTQSSLAPIDEDELFVENDISKPVIRKKAVIIKVDSSNAAYKDVERRFRRTHNINDSIFLANMYYKKRDYKKAIFWSKQTNKLDNNIEESWLIFAKSKVKLGHKNEAIRVLKAYIRRSNSYEAKKLLKKLIN
jgi:tetratricopeptide (TPR) repeat protein